MMKILALCFLVCGLVNGAPADTQGKKVFDLDVVETTTGFREVIEVDMDKGVVHISVPAHNDLDHTEFYLDFNTNRSVQVLPEKEVCYVAEMPKLPALKQLVQNLEGAQNQGPSAYSSSNIRRTNDMIVTMPVMDRDFLGYWKDVCPSDYPLYHLIPMNDHIMVTEETANVNTPANSKIPTASPTIIVAPVNRQKRTATFAFNFQCQTNLSQMKCRLKQSSSCFYVYEYCPLQGASAYCKDHVYSSRYICQPCCRKSGHAQDCAKINF